MIQVTKLENSILFEFSENQHYLYNGSIEVPYNTLSIIQDGSDMITLRKAQSNDIFLTARYNDFGASSVDDAVDLLADSLFKSEGGGGTSGLTPAEVQEMIDDSLDDYYDKDEVDAGLSGKADTVVVNQAISGVADDISAVSGQVATKVDESDFSAHTANTNIHVSSQEKNDWNNKLDADDLAPYWTSAQTQSAISGAVLTKQDTLVSGQNIKTINNQSLLGSGNINISGGSGSYVYYSENTTENTANIDIQTDDGEGNTAQYWLGLGGGSNTFGAVAETDDGEGNTTSSDGQINLDPIGGVTISASNSEGGQTTDTTLTVESTGVTINGENVVTENQLADYQPILSAGTGIDITNNVISATGGGGATYSAGTNISIDTANTINCTLNLSNGTGRNSITGVEGEAKGKYNFAFGQSSTAGTSTSDTYAFAFGYACKARKNRTFAFGSTVDIKEITSAAFGDNITLNAPYSFSTGHKNTTNNWVNIALGEELTTNNRPEFATGAYNNSVTSSTASGQTLFSVGNGTATNARHNAFEIRQNGDIYVNDGTNDVKLQDTITGTAANTTALGGLKFVKLTQAQYDNLVTKDADTMYIIVSGS